MTISLSHRDHAVLRAVAAGRCIVSGGAAVALLVDGVRCCDQFVGDRLTAAGLIVTPGRGPEPARLTDKGRALLTSPPPRRSLLRLRSSELCGWQGG